MKNCDKPTCGDHGGTRTNGEECARVAGWGTPDETGRCKQHKGTSPDGSSHEGNGNAAKHNLFSDRDKLYQRLEEGEQLHVDKLASSLVERYETVHGKEPDYAAKQRIKNVAIDIHKETLADNYMASQGDEHPLVEDQTIGFDQESMQEVVVAKPNKLLQVASRLKSDTRMWLKDLGLLEDPESQKAQSLEDVGTALMENLQDNY